MLALCAPGLGDVRRRAVHGRAPGLHHRSPVRLLVIARADHPDLAFEPEQPARERERRSPLPGAGLGRQLLDPGRRVLIRLGDGGVGLVRPGGRDALVLVVDVGGRIERALESMGAIQRRRAPQLVGVANRLRNLDLGLGRDLLQDQAHREDRRQIVGAGGLLGAGVQRRRRVPGEVGHQVDPVRRDVPLAQQELDRVAHRLSFARRSGDSMPVRQRSVVGVVDGLDVVAVGVEHERAVVAVRVLGT